MQLMWHGANMDGTVFPDPTVVDLGRDAGGHVTFGYGAHRCLGSSIARADLLTIIGTAIRRLPDYTLIPDGAVRYPSIGVSNNYVALPARFTPGRRVGVSDAVRAALEAEA